MQVKECGEVKTPAVVRSGPFFLYLADPMTPFLSIKFPYRAVSLPRTGATHTHTQGVQRERVIDVSSHDVLHVRTPLPQRSTPSWPSHRRRNAPPPQTQQGCA
jgi:hypothetical protein